MKTTPHLTLLCIIVLCMTSCIKFGDEFGNILNRHHTPVSDIPHAPRLVINKDLTLEFELIQEIIPVAENNYNQVSNNLILTNISNTTLQSVMYKLDVYMSEERSLQSIVLSEHQNYTRNIFPQETSDLITWDNTYDQPLILNHIDISIINKGAPTDHPFNGIYEGYYEYINTNGDIISGYTSGHIDHRGRLNLLLSNSSLIDYLEGQISQEGHLSADFYSADRTVVESEITTSGTPINLMDEELSFAVKSDSIVRGSSIDINFKLLRI